MMKRILIVSLAVCVLWVAAPLIGFAQEGPQLTWEKRVVSPSITGRATWQAEMPILSAAQLTQLREYQSRTHLPPPRTGDTRFAPQAVAPPLVTNPSYVKDLGIQADEDFAFRIYHELDATEAGDPANRSNVMSPTVAVKGGLEMVLTGNWFAAQSNDQGRNWTYIDPWTSIPIDPPRTGYEFSGSQEVIFDPVEQLFFWSILYVSETNTGGYLRIAVTKNVNSGIWTGFDFDFETDGATDTTLPDFPHLGLSRNYLYVTYNLFTDDAFTETCILRLPIMPMMRNESVLEYYYYSTDEVFTLKVAHDWCHHSTLYAVSNDSSSSSIRVYEWTEDNSVFTYHDISGLTAWTGYPTVFSCDDPGVHNPCGRLDDRVLAAVASYNESFPEDCQNQLWVAWTAAQDLTYTYPYIYLVKVCLNTWSVIDYAHVYNPSYALAYPAMAANGRGDIGITGDILGGTYYNLFWAAAIDEDEGYVPSWTLYPASTGDAGPSDDQWGDYNSCSAWYRNMYQWVGCGHVRYSDARESTPVYIRFCRERDF